MYRLTLVALALSYASASAPVVMPILRYSCRSAIRFRRFCSSTTFSNPPTPACTEIPTYQAFNEHLKVLRRLQLCKDLVSIDKLSLLFWSFPLIGQDLRESVNP